MSLRTLIVVATIMSFYIIKSNLAVKNYYECHHLIGVRWYSLSDMFSGYAIIALSHYFSIFRIYSDI